MPYRYFFILFPLAIVGSLCSILAKQDSRTPPSNERVAIVPGNSSPTRKSTEEAAESSKAAQKKKKELEKKADKEKKKTQERPNAEIKVTPAKNTPQAHSSQSAPQRVNTGQPARVNLNQQDRIQPKPANGKVAITPGKVPATTHKSKEKKKHSTIHEAAPAAVLHKKTHKPSRPARPLTFTVQRPAGKDLYETADSKIAIVPNATPQTVVMPQTIVMPQAVPQPAAYPVTVVNIVQEAPKRPIIISRPLPQTIVIDRRSAAYQYAALAPYAISPKGDFIQLEDGSQWKVRHRHYRTVKHWSPTDVVLIETGKFFTWSAYKLVNYSRNEFVDVEMVEPSSKGVLSHWIAEINVQEGYLRLQDGSIWRMSTNELLNWSVNDEVVIALGKDWLSGHSSYVLINPRVRNRLIAIFSY